MLGFSIFASLLGAASALRGTPQAKLAVVDVTPEHVSRDYVLTDAEGQQLPLDSNAVDQIETHLRAHLAGIDTGNLQITGSDGASYTVAGDEVGKLTTCGSAQVLRNGGASSPCTLQVSGYQWVTWIEYVIARCSPEIAKSLWKWRYLLNTKGGKEDDVFVLDTKGGFWGLIRHGLKLLLAGANSVEPKVREQLEQVGRDLKEMMQQDFATEGEPLVQTLLKDVYQTIVRHKEINLLALEKDTVQFNAENLIYTLPPKHRKPFINAALVGDNDWFATEEFIQFMKDFNSLTGTCDGFMKDFDLLTGTCGIKFSSFPNVKNSALAAMDSAMAGVTSVDAQTIHNIKQKLKENLPNEWRFISNNRVSFLPNESPQLEQDAELQQSWGGPMRFIYGKYP